jgi:hypothetical protein
LFLTKNHMDFFLVTPSMWQPMNFLTGLVAAFCVSTDCRPH